MQQGPRSGLEHLLCSKSWVELKVMVSALRGPRSGGSQPYTNSPALRQELLVGGGISCAEGTDFAVAEARPSLSCWQGHCASVCHRWMCGQGGGPGGYITLGLRSGFELYDWQN